MVAPAALWTAEADGVPASLDHIILGINDLDRGVDWMEDRTGVRARFGGAHPGRGTRNALLALGPQRYLEILAPDPKQAAQTWFAGLRELREPRLLGWAIHTSDVTALAKRVSDAGFTIEGPADGSRIRPDGKTLRWKLFRLKDDRGGLLPFFIEWSAESVHPSTDAPSGCRVVRFGAVDPDPAALAQSYRRLGVDVTVERSDKAHLRGRIGSPKGEVELS
jgi:hypothetical protein